MATPKFIARDCELSTTGIDAHGDPLDQWKVTRAILAEIPNVFAQRGGGAWTRDSFSSSYSMDCRRNWTSSGQCYYSDMSHVEVCTAETTSPRTFAAQSISTLLAAEEARQLAEVTARDEGQPLRLSLSAANADVAQPGISWGTHLNVATTEELWEDLFKTQRHPALLTFVSSAIAAAIPFFGCGYLLPMKEGMVYSLSARAHHIGHLHTHSTTEAFERGILNTRREPHGEGHARMHLIGFDFALAGAVLLASFVQCIFAAAEEGFCALGLFDPVRALRVWSWSLDLRTGCMPATAALVDGRNLTLPQYVRELAERLLAMCEAGLITPCTAPEATEMLSRIIELTHWLEEGAINRCSLHLDWAAKLLYLLGSQSDLSSAAARLADHDFANTDRQRGAFWRLWNEGLIDPLISIDDADACLQSAPVESRVAARRAGAEILRRYQRCELELRRTPSPRRWAVEPAVVRRAAAARQPAPRPFRTDHQHRSRRRSP